jgi:hypothetical protein
MTTRAPTAAPAMTEPAPVERLEFGPALQNLVATYWEHAEVEGTVSTEEDTVSALQFLFGSLAYELGRVDGVARLHGVERQHTLQLLGKAFAEGKLAALQQHHQTAKDCACEASAALLRELEFN